MSIPLNEQVKKAVKGNMFRFGSNREIRRLGEYLHHEEQVLKIVTGSRSNERGRGIVVATDARVLFIWDGWVFRENQDFPYDTISSIEFKTGVIFGTLTLYGKGDDVSYNWVDRFAGDAITKLVRQQIADRDTYTNTNFRTPIGSPVPSTVNQPPVGLPPIGGPKLPPIGGNGSTSHDVFQKIEELGKLRDQGYISPQDYEDKKNFLLAKI